MRPRRWTVDASTQVVDGPGSRRAVERVVGRDNARVFVVTNRSVARSSAIDDLTASWSRPPVGVFDKMRANAPAGDVAAALVAAEACDANVIVAVGGSSVTDAAKILRVRLLGETGSIDRCGLVLIPTTLSSGELTSAAGMTGEVAGEKTYVIDARMAPSLVVLDPELTRATPRDLWLSSGVKAVDHACEALWALDPHPYSDALAADALRRLLRALPLCAADERDIDARHDAQLGGWFSMTGMTRHGPGPSHLLGHQLAARWGIAHGITSCITLPHVARLAVREARPGVRRVAAEFGAAADSEVADAIADFVASLGLVSRLSEAGANESEIDIVADAAYRHGVSVGYRPERGPGEFADLLRAAW